MRTLVHISDVHFGRTDYATVAPLTLAIQELQPDLVVVSGDLTQRARSGQFIEARAFLDSLPQPQIVIPGNHDVPLHNVFARFITPLQKYRKYISEETEPTYKDEEIAVAGINTARSAVFKNGRINITQINKVAKFLCDSPENVTKVIVTHHPIDLPDGFGDQETVGRAEMAVKALAECGADLYLAGHYHFGHTGDTTTRYQIPKYAALIVHAGTATSTRGRGEPNSFNVIRIVHPHITVERYRWNSGRSLFELSKEEKFEKGAEGWARRDE